MCTYRICVYLPCRFLSVSSYFRIHNAFFCSPCNHLIPKKEMNTLMHQHEKHKTTTKTYRDRAGETRACVRVLVCMFKKGNDCGACNFFRARASCCKVSLTNEFFYSFSLCQMHRSSFFFRSLSFSLSCVLHSNNMYYFSVLFQHSHIYLYNTHSYEQKVVIDLDTKLFPLSNFFQV